MSVRVEIDLDEALLEALITNASNNGVSLAGHIEQLLTSSVDRDRTEALTFLTAAQLEPAVPFDFRTFDEIVAADDHSE